MRLKQILLIASGLMLSLGAGADDYRKLFQRVDPAVVTLYTVERNPVPNSLTGAVTEPGLGSGFLIDDEGHVMTAAHVVQTADLVEVEFVDGTRVTAAVVSSDPIKDVALLKLDAVPDDATVAKLGDSDDVRVGDEVFVIGAPLGLSHTLTVGYISSRRPYDDSMMQGIQAETFQTDAAINQGNSGGPLFNQRGEVIGIVSHIRTQSGGSVGLGFAVTIKTAIDVLLRNEMPWTGMSGIVLSGPLAEALNVPQPYGYLVQRTALNSPSSRIGLRPSRIPVTIAGQDLFVGGDIILAVDDIEISPEFDAVFREYTEDMQDGSLIRVKVLRGGKVVVLTSTIR